MQCRKNYKDIEKEIIDEIVLIARLRLAPINKIESQLSESRVDIEGYIEKANVKISHVTPVKNFKYSILCLKNGECTGEPEYMAGGFSYSDLKEIAIKSTSDSTVVLIINHVHDQYCIINLSWNGFGNIARGTSNRNKNNCQSIFKSSSESMYRN